MANIDTLLFNLASFIAGLFLLEYGADKFVDNTAIVAKRLKVSPTLVGLLTCGAEWEEVGIFSATLFPVYSFLSSRLQWLRRAAHCRPSQEWRTTTTSMRNEMYEVIC